MFSFAFVSSSNRLASQDFVNPRFPLLQLKMLKIVSQHPSPLFQPLLVPARHPRTQS